MSQGKHLLICTLGASWAVLPEVLSFLDPVKYPLLSQHPEREVWHRLLKRYGVQSPDELWIITTGGTEESLQYFRQWWEQQNGPLAVKIWSASNSHDLNTQQECENFRELVFRVCLRARDYTHNGGSMSMSLAGGRKTMSADLQQASTIFGATALLHVATTGTLPPQLFKPQAQDFCQALPAEEARLVSPILVGQGTRSLILDLQRDEVPPIVAKDYPVAWPLRESRWFETSMPIDTHKLKQEIENRQTESQQLLDNYINLSASMLS